jgi:hypothetical protein
MKAIEYDDEAIEIDPNYDNAWNDKGVIFIFLINFRFHFVFTSKHLKSVDAR